MVTFVGTHYLLSRSLCLPVTGHNNTLLGPHHELGWLERQEDILRDGLRHAYFHSALNSWNKTHHGGFKLQRDSSQSPVQVPFPTQV